MGRRLIWWPCGVPQGRRVGIVSSRLGNLSALSTAWYAGLRTICATMRAEGQVLVTGEGTALAELLMRCSRLFQIPLLLFDVARPAWSFERWLVECMQWRAAESEPPVAQWPALVSPPLNPTWADPVPARDALVVAASHCVVACRVRRNGNIFRLLERRLSGAQSSDAGRVLVAVGDGFVDDRVASELVARGAEYLQLPAVTAASSRTTDNAPITADALPRIVAADAIPVADYLVHCTRAADGPWPDQDRGEYLDSLILDLPDARRTALATLQRIVRQRRLLATARAIRGGTPVVCFTAAGLDQLPGMRTFRAHRRRWDFEPYGIGVARRWLEQQGGRPVTYGDDTLWRALPDADRPFFQRQLCGNRGALDWSVEREWRHVGDVDLERLPADAGFVFVPSAAEARQLSAESRWPLVLLR